ncbi:MAG: hypothetical protein GYB32_00290 [Algicola sp.]|nr:hypothetical protein [Algicola sp.]
MRLINTYIIAFSFLVIGCKNQNSDIKYYPHKNQYQNKETINLNLQNSSLNFKDINSLVNTNFKNQKRTLITFKDENGFEKIIIPLVLVELKKRNVLSITKDSILIDSGHKISRLKTILKRHYTNNGQNFRYPKSSQKAVVEITLELDDSAEVLKESLANLTKVFGEINNEIKEDLQLRIIFSVFRHIPPPPPNNN